jgi:hypothetical protein
VVHSQEIFTRFRCVARRTRTVLLGGTAYAAAIQLTGSETTKQYFVSENAPFTVTTVGAWQNVPTAFVSINVPSGTSRMIDARYTAESLCTGTGGWCSVRIALFTATGVFMSEFHPGAGTYYKFDTPGGAEETGALERTSGSVRPLRNLHGAGTSTTDGRSEPIHAGRLPVRRRACQPLMNPC